MTASSPHVVPLSACTKHDLDLAGGKGANLGELIAAGFDVPNGFVITTTAYDQVAAAAGLDELVAAGDAAGVRERLEQASLPLELAAEISNAYAQLGAPPVAVRSSATAEDLPGASFAGQQETFLNVTGTDAVLRAVVRCWASLWGDRAVAYRANQHIGDAPRMAVVVQELVDADASGVMFTANPANGRREETVITAAWGLGEAIVGGLVEPDEFIVDRTRPEAAPQRRIATKQVTTVRMDGGSEQVPTPASRAGEATLSDDEVAQLADLGARVQDHFGVPQDIEWARADGVFRLVQARPITALPEPVGEEPTEWPLPRPRSLYFRASIVEQMPDPLTPLFADLIRAAVPEGLNALLSSLSPGSEPLDSDFPTINGYAYYDYSREAMNRMWRLTPTALSHLTDKGFVIRRWRDEALPAYTGSVRLWATRDPAELPSSTLLSATRELLSAGCRYYSNVQMVIPMASISEMWWTGAYDSWMRRPGDPQATDFLLGFDSTPLRAEKALYRLATWCREIPGLAGALGTVTPAEVLEAPAPAGVESSDWAAFIARLRAHLDEFGHTIYNLDFANPVPADEPTPIIEALKHAISGLGADPVQRQQEVSRRRDRITRDLDERLDPLRGAIARAALPWAQRWAPIREDGLAAMGLAWPTMRRLLHELGRRLVAEGALSRAHDVYWLTADEADRAAAALDAGSPVEPATAIEERRRRWRGQALATPPQYLPVSRMMQSMDSMMPAHAGDQTGPVLKGTGGSGGRVTAPARVLAGPEDFGSFQPGEILVAAITTPAYTPFFALASGVVTDIGGVLSHSSIVAREYGIPAVLGTGTATKRISTGDVITLDGARATVRLDGSTEVEPAETRRMPRLGAGGRSRRGDRRRGGADQPFPSALITLELSWATLL